jgi:transcription initiation factor TFIIB
MHSVRKRIEEHPVLAFFIGAYAITWGIRFPVLTAIDRGPEWRAYDTGEKEEKSRVGAPATQLLHDKGLSTNIGWQNKDARGNSLSSRKRQKLHRLRTWNERFRTRNSKERNLKQALGESDRMASAWGYTSRRANPRASSTVVH